MFIIINIDEDSISVLDTSDGVIEVHPRGVVEQLSKRVNIAGVSNNKVTSYKDIKKVIRDLIVVEHKYEDAVKSLPEGYEITIYFKTKPTSGELHFVSHTNYNWRKSAINSWS